MIRENLVTTDYLDAVGAALLRGRGLEPSDDATSEPVALVNQHMAETLWPDQNPVGQQFRISLPPSEVRVVGVVPTAKYTGIGEDPQPAYLRPTEQVYAPAVTFFVRTAPGANGAVAEAHGRIREIDPSLPIFDVMPATGLVSLATWNTRAITYLLGGFGLVGLLLAAIGVYGVVSTAVRERTREMGLRMALGAQAPRMVLEVIRATVVVTGVGIGLGLLAAAVLTRPLVPQLFGVSPTDFATYVSTAVGLFGVAVVAALLPARRAARIAPTEALRGE